VARASTTSDVFNAISDVHQVSRHLRVLREVGLVRCRAEGRLRLYRLAPEHLQPVHAWVAQYEWAINDRLDRIDDYLERLQRQGDGSDT
jgi:DNA-binding transcriptional ArsR family regulator